MGLRNTSGADEDSDVSDTFTSSRGDDSEVDLRCPDGNLVVIPSAGRVNQKRAQAPLIFRVSALLPGYR
jgi:hypothetical protein